MSSETLTLQETREAPAAIARQLENSQDVYKEFAKAVRSQDPTSILTIARGSSDHAAHFAAYLIMSRLGRVVASLPMSVVTLYQSQMHAKGLLSFAFSQSGQSPDLIAPTKYFGEHNAMTAAVVNAEDSPLAKVAKWVFPLHAGPEKSVAATKSYIAQLVAGARITAAWQDDTALARGIAALPEVMTRACRLDWSAAIPVFKNAERLYVLGRGTGLAIAMEAALKFKETCSIQAEAFSGAEVKHGPMALIDEGYPLLIFAPRGPAQAGLITLADEMRARGAHVLLAAPSDVPSANLPLVTTDVVDLDPIAAIQSFYPMVEALARERGFNPDQPKFLAKVTKTH
jgi:glutamine---fructose-6-phosphate transaminase (isomerizing)